MPRYIKSLMLFSRRHETFRLPHETLLKGVQAGIQRKLYYELLGQDRHQTWVGLVTFARTT